MRKLTLILSLAVPLPLVLSACGSSEDANDTAADATNDTTTGDGDGDPSGDGDGDGDGDTTGDGDGDGDTTGDGDGDTTGDGDGDGDTTGDGDGDAGTGYCATACLEDADCCPLGSPNCPSDQYPDNYFCNGQGVCEFGGCSSDEDCTSGGLLPNAECHPIGAKSTCFEPCANDSNCLLQPGTTCSGVSDDGVSYCAPEPTPPCEDDADCAGYGICDVNSGECYCQQDGNCTAEGVDTCVPN